jgi:hypothetical protein
MNATMTLTEGNKLMIVTTLIGENIDSEDNIDTKERQLKNNQFVIFKKQKRDSFKAGTQHILTRCPVMCNNSS